VTRLPPAVQPLWPLAKKAHRLGARGVGAVARRTTTGDVLPRTATASSRESAGLEPDAVRYHVAREAAKVSRPLPRGWPADHWYFATILEHEVPETFVLDLDRGTVVGPHVAVVTPGGRLDNETSHYFGLHDWREHPVFLNPAPRAPEEVDGTLLVLAARATVGNYYHFLMDALPRLGILEEALPGVRPDAYLVDSSTRYHRELIGLLGLDSARLLSPGRGRSLRPERLLVPSLPNESTLAAPATTAWLNQHLPPRDVRGKPELLYVTRGRTKNTRRVVREEELVRRLARRGFVPIDPGSLSVQEQIDHFAAARVIVAPHGAALTNLNFCRPGVRLLELFAPGYLNPGYWSIVSNIEGSRYRYLVAPTSRPPRPGARLLGVMHDIDVDPSAVEEALDDLLADPPSSTPYDHEETPRP
jgi:capsular polysaccharide biosynthesis protein